MMKKIFSIIFIMILLLSSSKVNAANLSIYTNNKTVVNGNNITITVKADGMAGKFSITSSDSSILSGGTNSVWLENESKSYTFTAKKVGSATIKVTPIDVADNGGNVYSSSKSISINVVKPREKSNNNNLKSLNVEGYNISPEFNKDLLEYSVELPADTTKIKINADKEDGYASISGHGEKDVVEGDNRFEIIVTSETGTSKTYIINAIVKDNNPITVEANKKKLTVVKRSSSLTRPNDAFIDHTVTISEIQIPAFYNETTKIVLVGLKDEDGTIELYRYNESTNTYTKFQSFQSSSLSIVSEEVKDVPSDYKKIELKIDEKIYDVYINNKKEYLIYATNIITGKSNWYRYDEEEKTLQIYDSSEVEELKKEHKKTLEDYKLIILGLGTTSIILLIIIIILIIKRNKIKNSPTAKKLNKIKEVAEIDF